MRMAPKSNGGRGVGCIRNGRRAKEVVDGKIGRKLILQNKACLFFRFLANLFFTCAGFFSSCGVWTAFLAFQKYNSLLVVLFDLKLICPLRERKFLAFFLFIFNEAGPNPFRFFPSLWNHFIIDGGWMGGWMGPAPLFVCDSFTGCHDKPSRLSLFYFILSSRLLWKDSWRAGARSGAMVYRRARNMATGYGEVEGPEEELWGSYIYLCVLEDGWYNTRTR